MRMQVFSLMQQHLDDIERELRDIKYRLQQFPKPDPVPFPKPHIDHETQSERRYCNFCGKSQDEVAQLIAGPTVFICDECITLCGEIVNDRRKANPDT